MGNRTMAFSQIRVIRAIRGLILTNRVMYLGIGATNSWPRGRLRVCVYWLQAQGKPFLAVAPIAILFAILAPIGQTTGKVYKIRAERS